MKDIFKVTSKYSQKQIHRYGHTSTNQKNMMNKNKIFNT